MREDSVMVGYLNNEEANMTTFDRQGWMRHRLLPPGWLPLHRGQDQGADQSEGNKNGMEWKQDLVLSFLSFTTEIIQVAPAELEDVLRGLDVAVIGVESGSSCRINLLDIVTIYIYLIHCTAIVYSFHCL